MPYTEAWTLQDVLFERVVAEKLKRREAEAPHIQCRHYLMLLEHPPVFTLGRNGDEAHLLASPEALEAQGIEYHRINRGGDITYHGPGQLVGYPILDLDGLFTDIGRYLRLLEDCVIRVLAEYGLHGERLEGATGVWLDADNPFRARKICAIGIRASRWVTMHGFAFNVQPNLDHFKLIVPCGIDDKAVTSLSAELGRPVAMEEVKTRWLAAFSDAFGVELVAAELRREALAKDRKD
jgi:lipoyl(octanoyl) transferase